MVGEEREEESKEGRRATGDQLGSSDGAGQEVEQWQSEGGGAVSGEVEMRRLGRKGWQFWCRVQSREPGEGWLYLSVPTHTSRP